ncbi:MAG: hypothetical protein ACYDAK_13195 [Candidatus Limnocylindrales bacterium]
MLTTPGGTGGPDTVRRLNVPQPLRVEAGGDGTPRRAWHRGRWRAVTQVRERYRVDDRWWMPEPVARDYFALLLEDGSPLTVFRDRIDTRWYAQRDG